MLRVHSLCSAISVTFLLAVGAISAAAQTSSQNTKLPPNPRMPVPAQAAAIVSPEIQSDGKVTFRFFDPAAHEVLLSLQSLAEPAPMEKSVDGVWTVTVGSLAPEHYTYRFVVDRIATTDPSNPFLVSNLHGAMSVLNITGPASLPWQVNDVPHGVIHHEFYRSHVVGDDRDFYVYTPPDYDPRSEKRYPVLYLLHGAGETAGSLVVGNRANVVLDNLIAQRKAVPMIVVMPLCYGFPLSQVLPILRGRSASPEVIMQNAAKFTGALFTEVMPRVEKGYRVLPGPANTASPAVRWAAAKRSSPDSIIWIASAGSAGWQPRASLASTG